MQSLSPSDYDKSNLLSPLNKTGESLLRDLAHRTRAFRTVYEARKDLHWHCFIPYRRSRSLTLHRIINNLTAKAAQTYDLLGYFIHKFVRVLLPWTMLAYPDHMALHASFYSGGHELVVAAGDNQGPLLLTTIPSLRRLGCQLALEVFYLGDSDLSEESPRELERFPGVITRDLTLMTNGDDMLKLGRQNAALFEDA